MATGDRRVMGFLTAGLVLGSGALWGVRLILQPEPFADGSAALLAISVVVGGSVAALGLVLSRGRWARIVALGAVVAQMGLAVALDATVLGWAAVVATATTLVLLGGPWLDSFLRRLPPADPPPLPAVVLAIGLVLLPGILGLSAPGGIGVAHWVAAFAALFTGWAFSRALAPGLWSARLLLPSLLALAATQSPPVGTVLLAVCAVAVTALAWSPPVTRAVHPLVARADGVAVPPQLVPSDLLAQAGYDERGRPLRPEQ